MYWYEVGYSVYGPTKQEVCFLYAPVEGMEWGDDTVMSVLMSMCVSLPLAAAYARMGGWRSHAIALGVGCPPGIHDP